ncbi:MAG: hypothetical protein K5848_01465 [Lachnospiraceae bacterium]|nr:hypothetical protein [Lachnospiraceae bacterium]
MKKFRMLIVFVVIAILVIAGNNKQRLRAETECFEVDEYKAELIVNTHIKSLLKTDNDIDTWRGDITVLEPVLLYDFNERISAYYFEIVDKELSDIGYVVVGAREDTAPIIEYATEGDFYPYEEYKKMEADRIIYNGGYDYYLKKGSCYYNVSGFGVTVKLSSDECEKLIANGFYADNSFEEWQEWKALLDKWTGCNITPSLQFITNPFPYEQGYQSCETERVTGYNNTYRTTGYFSGYTNHCAPVAATNMMIYWYNRSSNYHSLKKYADSTWGATFLRYHALMQTDPYNGTLTSKVAPAYNSYLSEAGVTGLAVLTENPSWNTLKGEINQDRPFHTCVYNNAIYGCHSLFAVGYSKFTHPGGATSKYLIVADGYASSPSRYLHLTIYNTNLDIIKVYIS